MEKVATMLQGSTTENLLDIWESTESMEGSNLDIATMRGWILDEIEKRFPERFEEWLGGDDCYDNRLRYYITKE